MFFIPHVRSVKDLQNAFHLPKSASRYSVATPIECDASARKV